MKKLVVFLNEDGSIEAYWRIENGEDLVSYEPQPIDHLVVTSPDRGKSWALATGTSNGMALTLLG